jgi:gamma-glutamyltranspeptidase/glutathione hydrolase
MSVQTRLSTSILVVALVLASCSSGTVTGPAPQAAVDLPASRAPHQPEPGSGYRAKPGWRFARQAVAAANPLAAEAGAQMLRAGGSAIDAAIAAQMVLTLVEPQSSGIGGGAFLLHWDGRRVQAWDGRETAPAAPDETLFLQADGKPMGFLQGAVGGRAVGVPGAVRMLETAHRAHGRLPWAALFEPAITLAEDGFAVSPRLHALLAGEAALKRDAQARRYFYDEAGRPWPVGHRLRNPALAAVLREIAARGSIALHEGRMAEDIVQRVRGHAGNPGTLSLADLAGYRVLEREPMCNLWRERWRICGFPPPGSGHIAVMQTLYLLDAAAPAADEQAGPIGARPDAEWLHRFAESLRLAFADRAQYLGDPDFVPAPAGRWGSLLDPDYLQRRAALVGPRRMEHAPAGRPGPVSSFAAQAEQPEYGTSHISVVDGQGRALALTTSIESVFGSRLMSDGGTGLAGGFLLNNHLSDFAQQPRDARGRPVANRLEPGKRPRSAMSPTLVFDRQQGGRLQMSLGSPGGAAIIPFVAQTLVGTLAWGLDAQRAIDLPHAAALGGDGGALLVEQGGFAETMLQGLRERGHRPQPTALPSGLQAIERRGPGWFGAADPRREGEVRGD